MGRIAQEVRGLVAAGYKEVVITGVDITGYGSDLPGAPALGQMLRRLLMAVPELPRLRLSSLDPAEVARATHVSEEAIGEAARLYGRAGAGAIVYALDNIPADLRQDCVRALTDLSLITGNLGKPGSGLYPLRQGANEQGAWDVGCLPDRLPGYANVADAEARRTLESTWGCVLPVAPGMGAAAALEAAREGRVRAMLIIGDSVNLENGALGDGVSALDALEFLVVADSFMSPSAQRASVVLPRATFAEKDGTFTNMERRIQRVKPALQGESDQARPESWVICQLAQRMSSTGFGHPSAAETMDEIARLVPMYGGVSYQRLESSGKLVFRTHADSPQPTQVLYSSRENQGIQWPCVAQGGETTPTLYVDGFPAEKAEVETPQFRAAKLQGDPTFPALLVPGRVLQQLDREFEVVKGKRNAIVREDLLELNPVDAASWGIQEGDEVEVSAGGRRITGRAVILASLPPGIIATTSLFGQMVLDLQASEEVIPAARLPGLPIQPASIAKAGAARI